MSRGFNPDALPLGPGEEPIGLGSFGILTIALTCPLAHSPRPSFRARGLFSCEGWAPARKLRGYGDILDQPGPERTRAHPASRRGRYHRLGRTARAVSAPAAPDDQAPA